MSTSHSAGRVTKAKKTIRQGQGSTATSPMETSSATNKSEAHLVPWCSRDEWEHVCRLVNESNWEEASKVLNIWEQRVPALPLVTEATKLIIDAKVYDLQYVNQSRSDTCARAMYSLSLLRFLNYAGHYAATLSGEPTTMPTKELTAAVGVPDWMVKLRNELSHGVKMPSLEALRLAGDCILDWIKKFYWKLQHSGVLEESENFVLNPSYSNGNILHRLLASFVTLRRHKKLNTRLIECPVLLLKASEVRRKIKTEDALKQIKTLILSWIRSNWDITRDVLADALMCPTLDHILTIQGIEDFQILCWVWNPIIKAWINSKQLSELLVRIGKIHVDETNRDDKYNQDLSALWIRKILGILDTGRLHSNKYMELFQLVLHCPNSSTEIFVSKLLQVLGTKVDPEIKANFVFLSSAWSNHSPRIRAYNQQLKNMFSIEDLPNEVSKCDDPQSEGVAGGPFVMDHRSSEYWSSVPIGGFVDEED